MPTVYERVKELKEIRLESSRPQAKMSNNGQSYTVQVKIEWVESPNTHRKREHIESREFVAVMV